MSAVDTLFSWCRIPDVADPKVYLVGAAAILDEYPPQVGHMLADPRTGTKLLKPFPSLFDIREACDKAYEPIERQVARDRARESHLTLPAPSKADQERRDAQIADYEQRIKPTLIAAFKPMPVVPNIYTRPIDGKHAERVAADLARRTKPSTDPPSKESAA